MKRAGAKEVVGGGLPAKMSRAPATSPLPCAFRGVCPLQSKDKRAINALDEWIKSAR